MCLNMSLLGMLLAFLFCTGGTEGRETESLMTQFALYNPGMPTYCDTGLLSDRECDRLDQTTTGFQAYNLEFMFDELAQPEIRLDLTGVKEIRTVHLHGYYLNLGEIRIGNDATYANNPVCATSITDSGWYECGTPLFGQYIFVKRISEALPDNFGTRMVVYSIRAYKGVNVAQWAGLIKESITFEPSGTVSVPDYTGANLLTMNPRRWTDRDPSKRNIQFIPGDTTEGGVKVHSCAFYKWDSTLDPTSNPIEVTIKLDYPYLIDSLFFAGDPAMITLDDEWLTGPYEIFVGWSPDYKQNQSCTGGPYETWPWSPGDKRHNNLYPGGDELFCGLPGQYVTFLRHYDAIRVVTDLQEITHICVFGVISDLDSRVTISLDSLSSQY